MKRHTIEISSALAVEPDAFWAQATLSGINRELAPWVRMTAAPSWRERPLLDWPVGSDLFKSWILLFGLLPVDLHCFRMEICTPDVGFEERSRSAMNRHWNHDRRTAPIPGGCILTDRIEFESRFPLIGRLLLPVYAFVFAARHRQLRRTHGRAAEPSGPPPSGGD